MLRSTQRLVPDCARDWQSFPRLHVGEFHYTDGYDLTNALGEKVAGIFHVRGPLWQNGALGEEAQLRKCYLDLLEAAHGRGVQAIAFP